MAIESAFNGYFMGTLWDLMMFNGYLMGFHDTQWVFHGYLMDFTSPWPWPWPLKKGNLPDSIGWNGVPLNFQTSHMIYGSIKWML